MFWPVFLVSLVFDQLTKLLAAAYLETSLNHGISFGWLANFPSEMMTALLVFLAMIMAYSLRREWRRRPVIAGLFWAGVVSNLLDRILLGGVIDWISLPYVEIKNNLADFYLAIALILLFIKELRSHSER
jgi:lipoprotein signal peptidase